MDSEQNENFPLNWMLYSSKCVFISLIQNLVLRKLESEIKGNLHVSSVLAMPDGVYFQFLGLFSLYDLRPCKRRFLGL